MSVSEELLTYIRNEQGAGVPPETIQGSLKNAGWLEEDIKNAFASLGQNVISLEKKTPWYGVPGYEGILNWKALIVVFFIPFASLIYPFYLIVIAVQRKSSTLFWEGFKRYLIVFILFSLIGIALLLGMFHSYNVFF